MKNISKKVTLCLAVSMIFSLAVIQGISQKNRHTQEIGIQQVGAGTMIVAAHMENKAAGVATGFYGGAVLNFTAESAGVWMSMGPVGWVIGGGLAL